MICSLNNLEQFESRMMVISPSNIVFIMATLQWEKPMVDGNLYSLHPLDYQSLKSPNFIINHVPPNSQQHSQSIQQKSLSTCLVLQAMQLANQLYCSIVGEHQGGTYRARSKMQGQSSNACHGYYVIVCLLNNSVARSVIFKFLACLTK